MSILPQSKFKEASPNASLMTFVVGSKCVDGVVLISDRKIIKINKDGLNFDYQKKLFAELRHVVFGSSGLREIMGPSEELCWKKSGVDR
jgi:20S proteasome alpha/beta subunit